MGNLGLYMLAPYLYMILGLGLSLVIFKFGLKFLKDRNKNQINQFIIGTFLVLKV